MANKPILKFEDFNEVMKLFENGAKLCSVQYTACGVEASTNDVRTATLSFIGQTKFSLKFEGIDCLHIAPITMGNISVSDVALGKMGMLYFWSDDSSFDITEPDTSTSYVIARAITLIK